MSATLHVEDVGVRAGRVTLLDGVSMTVAPGRIVAVVGANGAGKTTLLDAICGVVPCHQGNVLLDDQSTVLSGGRPHPGIARVFQGSPLPATLTVAEVVALVTPHHGAATELLERFGLAIHASSFVAELSTGMKRILDLAVATQREPTLLLLDEPSSGLAPSEVDQLAELILDWRDRSGAAVVIVEHDAALVTKVADEIVVLEGGRVVRTGSADELGGRRSATKARVRNPADAGVQAALDHIGSLAIPATPPQRRTLSTWSLLRLGLREMAAGLASVLIVGVLNRVMKVELGISLGVVAAIIASYNLAAPLALAIGHRSDTTPIFGYRRTPYIIGGSIVAGLAVIAAPHAAGMLAGGITATAVLVGLALFIVMGVGMYGSGTVYFALLADITNERERGWAASIVYLELMVGILVGVALTGSVLDEDANGLTTLFTIAGVLVVVLTVIAVWGRERRVEQTPAETAARVTLRAAVRSAASMGQTRLFFLFMIVSTIFLFLQQAVLEPFGGDVLGLDVRATSGFNAVQTFGILAGMLFAGRALADRYGHKRVAAVGLIGSALSFAALAFAAFFAAGPPSWLSILAIGLTTGLLNVAALALMMDMADPRRMALFMGAWTVAHALADGIATAGGGIVYEIALRIAGSEPGAYATVFALEAIGLAACLPLLSRVDPDRFHAEADATALEPEPARVAA